MSEEVTEVEETVEEQEATVDINLSVTEANTVLAALGELPAKHVMSLIAKIQTQAQQQLQ